MSSKEINILVASMTGNALMSAEEIAEYCKSQNINAYIEEIEHTDISILNNKGTFLICSSTYGQGDIPDTAHKFFNELKETSPDLSHIKYLLFGLGDMTYKETFAQGGKKFDYLLKSLKAKRIVDPFYHDASDGTLPEEMALVWFKNKVINLI